MTRPRISVALPVYNGANYLSEALESILAQEYTDFELVVSDNCSTDRTPEILAEFAGRDTRVRVSRSEQFLQHADSVSRAVDLCASDWVKLFCHDDLMQPGCLGSVRRAIDEFADDSVGLIGNGEGWLFSNGYYFNPTEGRKDGVKYLKGPDFVKQLLDGKSDIAVPSVTTATVRKKAWESSRKFDNRFLHFDVFLWMQLLRKWNFLFISEALATTRIHSTQVSVYARKSLRSINDYRIFFKEYLAESARSLELSAATRLKVRLKPVSVAATTIATEIIKGNTKKALGFLFCVPLSWWPVLPLLIVRNLRHLRRKARQLAGRVPLSLIYPE